MMPRVNALLLSGSITALRLSVFALAWLVLGGVNAIVPLVSCLLAAVTLYAFAKANDVLLMYCHVVAAAVWAGAATALALSGVPWLLVLGVYGMAILDGLHPYLRR
jgi:hypothetical protein